MQLCIHIPCVAIYTNALVCEGKVKAQVKANKFIVESKPEIVVVVGFVDKLVVVIY